MNPRASKVCIHQVTLCMAFAVSGSTPAKALARAQPTKDQTSQEGLGHVDPQRLDDEAGDDDPGNEQQDNGVIGVLSGFPL